MQCILNKHNNLRDEEEVQQVGLFIIQLPYFQYQILLMSSPSLRKQSASPIRNLQDKSPRRNARLQTILQEESYLARPLRVGLLERENSGLTFENQALNTKVRNYAEEATRFMVQNSRLAQENEVLKDLNFRSNVVETQKLAREIYLKDGQIEKLNGDIALLKAHYDRSLNHFQLENEGLKNQLVAIEARRFSEVEQIKTKYTAIANEDMSLARKGYYDDLARLVSSLQSTKALLAEKQKQIKHLAAHGQNLVREHSIYLEQLVSENNILRNHVLQTQIRRDSEVKHAESKRELEKSRTQGIISFCKENAAYIEKEISRLAQQLLEKSISIEQFTKDILKSKRNLELTQKRYEHKIENIQKDCDDKLLEQEQERQKQEKYHKQEIADMKKIEMELQEKIATKQNQIDSLQRENEHNKKTIQDREIKIQELKTNLSKLHDDHAKQISKVMTDSRVKRKSMKNLSQSSSLRDLSADGNSSIIKRPVQRQNSIVEGREGSSGQLYTVHEQLAASQLVQNEQEEQDDGAVKDLIALYQNTIQELKSNKALELSIAHENIQKLNQSLREKQQELLEILERFSPLMEYKLNSTSITEERKEKIQKHYKANIDLLSVMLDKYSIVAVSKKK